MVQTCIDGCDCTQGRSFVAGSYTKMIEQRDAGLRSLAARADANGRTPWPALIEKIQADDAEGMEELYHVFSRGVRFFLWRQLGKQDLDDSVHDTFVAVAEAIRRGDVREPDRLMGFVWTVVRRHLAAYIDRNISLRHQSADLDGAVRVQDRNTDPEWKAIVRQQQVLARRMLAEVSARDREVLIRFYLKEQSQEQICREMQLTPNQFRLLKSRAKARLEVLGRKKLSRHRICWQ